MPKKKAKTTHSVNSVAGTGPQQIPAANQAGPNIQNAGAVNNNNQNNGDLSSAPASKKRKRKINPNTVAYNSKTYQTQGKSNNQESDATKRNVLYTRTDNSLTYINENNESETLRTSVAFDEEKIKNSIHDKKKRKRAIGHMKGKISGSLKNIKTYRPLLEVTKYDKKTGSPIKGIVGTPSDPKKRVPVVRLGKMGVVSLFGPKGYGKPHHKAKKHTSIDPKNLKEFQNSSSYKAVNKVHDRYKLKYKNNPVKITPQSLAKTKKEIAANGGRREKSQNEVQVEKGFKAKDGSSPQYVQAAKLHDENLKLKWEWLHLVAHMILGKLSQDTDNLVAGTTHANTAMMFADVDIPYLAKMYPDGFDLEIWADLVAIDPAQNIYTQIASTIYYKVITKDFTWDLTFNAQDPNKPHIDFGEYLHAALVAMVDFVKFDDQNNNNNNATPANQNNNSASPVSPVNNHQFLFYKKKLPNNSNNINNTVAQHPTVGSTPKKTPLKTNANANPANAGAPIINANPTTTNTHSTNTKNKRPANLGFLDRPTTRSQTAEAKKVSHLPPNKKQKIG